MTVDYVVSIIAKAIAMAGFCCIAVKFKIKLF